MFGNYLMAAFRNILKYKFYAFINIFGLAIGLAACSLILLFVDHETSYDKGLVDLGRLYRIEADSNIPGRDTFPVASFFGTTYELIPQDYDEVEAITRLQQRGGQLIREAEAFDEVFSYADPTFLDVIALPFLEGNPENALKDPSSIILTEEMAIKHLGDSPWIGQTIRINETYERDLKVTGILKNIPENSHLDLDFVLPIDQ